MPTEFCAIAQTEYVVPVERPVTGCEYVTGELPNGIAVPPVAGTRVPKASLQTPGLDVAKRNHAVAAAPLGFALPLKVPVVDVRIVGVPVVTPGTCGGVVKVSNAPSCVPMVFWAIAQKKYVLPGSRLEMDAAFDVGVLPEPTKVPPDVGVRVPKVSLQAVGSVRL
jgi:hypothetical protein